MELVHEAASVLSGVHDFKAFTHPSSLLNKPPLYSTWRDMEVSVEPGTGFMSSYLPPFADQFDYWNFVFKSRSFLNRQASYSPISLSRNTTYTHRPQGVI